MGAVPQMRGFLVSRFKRDMVIMLAASVVTVSAWRLLYVNPRRQRYADFYKYVFSFLINLRPKDYSLHTY